MGKKRNKVEIFKLEDRVLFEAGAVVQAAEAAAADQANNDAAGDGSAAAEMQSDNNQTASDELTPDHLAEMPVPPEMSGSDNADDTADADAADFAAAEVMLNVGGYRFKWGKQNTNNIEEGKVNSSGANFRINLFSIKFGVTYYL